MVPKQVKTRLVNRDLYSNYWLKASEYKESMIDNLTKNRFNAAAGDAVHCVISAADALLVWLAGKRSASENHGDLVYLLQRHVKSSANINRLKSILQVKSQIEYGERLYPKGKAEEMVKKAERFYDWIAGQLPKY